MLQQLAQRRLTNLMGPDFPPAPYRGLCAAEASAVRLDILSRGVPGIARCLGWVKQSLYDAPNLSDEQREDYLSIMQARQQAVAERARNGELREVRLLMGRLALTQAGKFAHQQAERLSGFFRGVRMVHMMVVEDELVAKYLKACGDSALTSILIETEGKEGEQYTSYLQLGRPVGEHEECVVGSEVFAARQAEHNNAWAEAMRLS